MKRASDYFAPEPGEGVARRPLPPAWCLRVCPPVGLVLGKVAADDGTLARAVGVHGHELGREATVQPVRVHDLRPVRRPDRVAPVVETEVGEVVPDVTYGRTVDDPRPSGPVGIHHVDVALAAELAAVARVERDLLPARRPVGRGDAQA